MILLVVAVFTAFISEMALASHCTSYCNADGFFVASYECPPIHGFPQYCCGNETVRSCCLNASGDISDVYGDMCYCMHSNCSFSNWQAFGTVSVICVLFVIILVGCVNRQCSKDESNCKCSCFGLRSLSSDNHWHATAQAQEDVQTVSGAFDNNMSADSREPPNRFIYSPPSYESIVKDPPKYEELIRDCGVDLCNPMINMDYSTTNPSPSEEARTVVDVNADTVPCNEITCVDVPPSYCTVEFESSTASHI